MKTIVTASLSLLFLGTISCKKVESAINDTATQGNLTANVDGASYTAPTVSGSVSGTTFFLRGNRFGNDEEISFDVSNYSTSQTHYDISIPYVSGRYITPGGDTRTATSGEINIESTGDKSAKGTFSFETENGTKVTDGKFDVHWD
jgi:hypothetical protein